MERDSFKTLAEPANGIYKEKGSKFLAFAYSVSGESEIKEILQKLRKEHPDANHVCYAILLFSDHGVGRSNDDGEPAGTAGKPILNQIYSSGLENVLLAVVRYFGGTKLGVGGLIKAYKTAASEALNSAIIIEKRISKSVQLHFPFSAEGEVQRIIKRYQAEIIHKEFQDKVQYIVQIPLSDFSNFEKEILDVYLVELVKN